MGNAQDWLSQVQADSLARLEAVERMQRELEGIVGEAATADRAVSLTVSPSGALSALRIDEEAMASHSGPELAAVIARLAAEATARAAARIKDVVGDVVPAADLDALMQGSIPPSTQDSVRDELRARREGER